MVKAIVIPVDEAPRVETLDGYEALSAAVGGWLELLRLSHDAVIYVDEEGKLKGLPINERANRLLHEEMPIGLAPNDRVVGTIVILGCLNERGEHTGDEYDVPQYLIDQIVE